MLCGSTVSGGLQGERLAFRRSFSRHYTHSNIQLNNVRALWKYSVWWASSRSNAFQKKFFKTLYTFKHTIEQSMRSVKVQLVVGVRHKQWLSEEIIETLYTFKHTFELCMRNVEVHCVVGFKQKQWLSEYSFQNNINIQTYNWTNMRSVKVQCVLGFKHKQWLSEEVIKTYKKICALWKYTEWWASSRSNGFQKKFSKTFYTFKQTIEQCMRSVKVHWAVGFKQK